MQISRYLIIISIAIIAFSCSSKKQILYMQDIENLKSFSSDYEEYKVNVDDILKIDISTKTAEPSIVVNPNGLNTNNTPNKEALLYDGYQVDSEGNINFPSIGKINVKGKSIREIRDYLYSTIKDLGLLIDPFVDVKLLNGYFTILGEVNNPGRFEYLKNNLNILEAIGMAGDLTINGLRKDIKIIRKIDDKNEVSSIDLTNTNFLNTNFQVFSGDVIIVNPNLSRIKNAGIIGNSGTLLSLLTFILSSIIVISN